MEKTNRATIVIIGASGFIGRQLAIDFSRFGHNVVGISTRETNIKDLNYTHYKVKSYSYENLSNIITIFNVDHLISGFGGGNPTSYNNQPTKSQVEIDHIKILIKICKEYMINPIYLSTCGQLYNTKQLFQENILNLNLYNTTKILCESLIQNELPNSLILRVSNVFGVIRDYKQNGIIDIILNNVLKNKPTRIHERETKLDFIYISDFTAIVNSLLGLKASGCFNICSGLTYSLSDIKFLFEELFPQVNFVVEQNKNLDNFLIPPENKKLISMINYKFTSIKDYLIKYV